MIIKDVISELRNSLAALISLRDRDPKIIDEIEQYVYEALALKELDAFSLKFVFASLDMPGHLGSSMLKIFLPQINCYLYFSAK